MSERIELSPCARCGEDAIMVELDGKYFARVRRFSKCKHYKQRRQSGDTCQTEWRDTPEEAAAEWEQATISPLKTNASSPPFTYHLLSDAQVVCLPESPEKGKR